MQRGLVSLAGASEPMPALAGVSCARRRCSGFHKGREDDDTEKGRF